jgi:hypothetical protein
MKKARLLDKGENMGRGVYDTERACVIEDFAGVYD